MKIGSAEVKTPYLVAAGATALVLIVYAVIRRRQASAAAAAAAPSSAGQVDPATGDVAGSPQDQADLAALQGGDAGLGYGGYGGALGGGYGYPNTTSTASGPGAIDPNSGIPYAEEAGWVYNDQSGTWQYMGTGSGNVGGGAFTTNGEWLKATEQYFVDNGLVADNGQALVAALGKYLAGAPVTPDQETLIHEATGIENYPPVAGPGGFPPGIHLASSQGTPPPGGGGSRPATPSGLSVTPQHGFADFGWGEVAGATSYELLVTGAGGKGSGPSHADRTSAGNHAEHVALDAGRYVARVRASNSAGTSSWSAEHAFTAQK